MSNLEITISTGDPGAELPPILDIFQRDTRTPIELRPLDWGDAWKEFLRISLRQRGPVVSETGTTWMRNLVGMTSLREFSAEEVRQMGGASAFPRSIWESCLDPGTGNLVAIPWIVDTYLAYYRADVLEQAGVDARTAFSTLDHFRAALDTLKTKGVASPLALPTAATLSTTHNLASWIWGMGGDLITRDGQALALHSTAAREGIYAFYDLIQFIAPPLRNLDDDACEEAFLRGEAAIIIRNPSLLHLLKSRRAELTFGPHIKTAVQPGVPMVGGSNLIIWNHAPPALILKAVAIIRYLTNTDAQLAYFDRSGMLPARLDAIQRISADAEYAPVFQALLSGRDLPYLQRWGLVEDRLSDAFSAIWRNVLDNPTADIKPIVETILAPVEARLNTTLAQ